ncbi:hypothetical protein HQN90_11090 [Paenibacillus alba]|uniref:hypothetical protein n=1 Tax=Paenibacillus alba TaxID=1197127 RepID=UPI00156632FE|nr:hypothetical protein [Paenibacillus alba]NQX66672.1 hypothetical protein [Paenibacillus alba]
MKLKLIHIPLLLAVAFVAFLTFPWLAIFIGIHSQPNPPRPEITHGEFPFRLEYELNGQRKVIEDTIICDFDGFGADEGRGKYRNWKVRLVSGSENVTLLKVDDKKEIEFSHGSAEYYMGDSEIEKNDSSFPDAIYVAKNSSGIVRANELFDSYHIKLISWESAPPI